MDWDVHTEWDDARNSDIIIIASMILYILLMNVSNYVSPIYHIFKGDLSRI